MIGGTGRNVGKTEFVCQCIKYFSQRFDVIALKVTNHFHEGEERTYSMMIEEDSDSHKDTSRMLRAGAKKAWYVQSEHDYLSKAFADFEHEVNKDTLIICESNGLRDIVVPGLFIVVKNTNLPQIKDSAKRLIHLSDKVIVSDGLEFDFLPEEISIVNQKWTFVNSN